MPVQQTQWLLYSYKVSHKSAMLRFIKCKIQDIYSLFLYKVNKKCYVQVHTDINEDYKKLNMRLSINQRSFSPEQLPAVSPDRNRQDQCAQVNPA